MKQFASSLALYLAFQTAYGYSRVRRTSHHVSPVANALTLQTDSIQNTDVLGQLVGDVGYIRNYNKFTSSHSMRSDCRLTQLAARVADQDVGKKNTHQLLNEYPEQISCDPFQDSQFQADGFPRLKAGPGSHIVTQYLESGRISAPVS